MRNAKVVIGAGYGDEGKGLVTDWLCAASAGDTLAVRFNGGAQAGHTVATATGLRHVFSHYGSGSFAGAATCLSRFFVCHPMLFQTEQDELRALGFEPKVFVDPRALVTTPYDIMLNQALELSRGRRRHGSCGLGFGETIERNECSPYQLHAGDLRDADRVIRTLRQVRDWYLPRRLRELELPPLAPELMRDEIIERYVEDTTNFTDAVELVLPADIMRGYHVVFEGAQGLLLDMDRGYFPHVTRSNTGLKNVVTVASEVGITALDVTYATRAYVSRHGAGPLAHELTGKPFPGVEDLTNVCNRWQESLRFGWLDVDVLAATIRADLSDGKGLVASTNVLVSCLDQAVPDVRYVCGGTARSGSADELLAQVRHATDCDNILGSYGPTRDGIRVDGSSGRINAPSQSHQTSSVHQTAVILRFHAVWG